MTLEYDHQSTTSPLYNFACGLFGFRNLYNAGVRHGHELSSSSSFEDRKAIWRRGRESFNDGNGGVQDGFESSNVPLRTGGDDGDDGDDDGEDDWMRMIKDELVRARRTQVEVWNEIKGIYDSRHDQSSKVQEEHESSLTGREGEDGVEKSTECPFSTGASWDQSLWGQVERVGDAYIDWLERLGSGNHEPRAQLKDSQQRVSAETRSRDQGTQAEQFVTDDDFPISQSDWHDLVRKRMGENVETAIFNQREFNDLWHSLMNDKWSSAHRTGPSAEDSSAKPQASLHQRLQEQRNADLNTDDNHTHNDDMGQHSLWSQMQRLSGSDHGSVAHETTIEQSDKGFTRRTVCTESSADGIRRMTSITHTAPDGQTETTENTEFFPAPKTVHDRRTMKEITWPQHQQQSHEPVPQEPIKRLEPAKIPTKSPSKPKGGWFWSSG